MVAALDIPAAHRITTGRSLRATSTAVHRRDLYPCAATADAGTREFIHGWGVTLGYNDQGRLGVGDTGDTADRSLPTITPGGGWSTVSVGGSHACGLMLDGTRYCWGENAYGRLGLSGTTNRGRQIRIVNEHKWTQIAAGLAHTCGIGVDGRLSCWGLNATGELGLGDTTNRTTPALVS